MLDFYCSEHRLAIELDGAYHFKKDQQAYDEARTDYFRGYGIRILRFENWDVKKRMEVVLKALSKQS